MTSIGFIGAIVLLISGHKPKTYKGSVYFEIGKSWGGVNFGPFFFVDDKTTLSTIQHEWGHGIQNIILGPLMPFLVAIPSALRYHYRNFITSEKCPEKWRKKWFQLPDYDSVWFEGQATKIGVLYYEEGDYKN